MEVNILLVIVGGIIAIGAIVGFAKGAVRIAVSLGATILTLAVVYFATPYVSKAIYSLTPIDEMVEQQCIKTMTKAFTGEAVDPRGDDQLPVAVEFLGGRYPFDRGEPRRGQVRRERAFGPRAVRERAGGVPVCRCRRPRDGRSPVQSQRIVLCDRGYREPRRADTRQDGPYGALRGEPL